MPKPLPFTEEEMKQVFATNLIEYARSQGFEVEKADRKTYHVKGNSGVRQYLQISSLLLFALYGKMIIMEIVLIISQQGKFG